MNEDFVPFEIAKKLKEKGFREKCLLHYESTGGFYSNSIDTYDRPNQELDYSDFLKCFNGGNSIGLIDAPTISQVLKWLREDKKIFIRIDVYENDKFDYFFGIAEQGRETWGMVYLGEEDYKSYEFAAIAGIEYVIDNLI